MLLRAISSIRSAALRGKARICDLPQTGARPFIEVLMSAHSETIQTRFVDLGAMRYLMAGLTFNIPRCAEALDAATVLNSVPSLRQRSLLTPTLRNHGRP